MVVVGIAHQDEIRALHARDRALNRLMLIAPGYATLTIAIDNRRTRRRWMRARSAYESALRVLWLAQQRHSMWYRAYLRARRGRVAS